MRPVDRRAAVAGVRRAARAGELGAAVDAVRIAGEQPGHHHRRAVAPGPPRRALRTGRPERTFGAGRAELAVADDAFPIGGDEPHASGRAARVAHREHLGGDRDARGSRRTLEPVADVGDPARRGQLGAAGEAVRVADEERLGLHRGARRSDLARGAGLAARSCRAGRPTAHRLGLVTGVDADAAVRAGWVSGGEQFEGDPAGRGVRLGAGGEEDGEEQRSAHLPTLPKSPREAKDAARLR